MFACVCVGYSCVLLCVCVGVSEGTSVITEANSIVGLYLYSVFTNPMLFSTNSLSIVYTFS